MPGTLMYCTRYVWPCWCDVDISCVSVYICIICWRWWFIHQHTNLLIRTKLPTYVIFTDISICNQCVHQYVQVISTLACVRICVYRLTNYNNQPSILWTIDHCQFVIFFITALSNPSFCVFLVNQCQKKIHKVQVKQNNKQWGRENLLKTYWVEATIR
jgi:hypothetical protein